MLYQYHHETSLFFGHRYIHEKVENGYMAGAGYVLSKGALKKFVTQIIPNATQCRMIEMGAEDMEMGICLNQNAIFVDERDENQQKRFFPTGFIYDHLYKEVNPDYWYVKMQYYDSPQGSLDCCSDVPIAFHYVKPEEMHYIQYFTRNVHPFGVSKNITETLPRKLSLEEIIRASDMESNSVNFKPHQNVHNIDTDELYKR